MCLKRNKTQSFVFHTWQKREKFEKKNKRSKNGSNYILFLKYNKLFLLKISSRNFINIVCFGVKNSGSQKYYGLFNGRHTQHNSVDYLNMLPDYFYAGGLFFLYVFSFFVSCLFYFCWGHLMSTLCEYHKTYIVMLSSWIFNLKSEGRTVILEEKR